MANAVTCLFVDDDPGVRELVAVNLRAEGYRVHLTDGGYGVERLVEMTEPDVVLLDIMMPERDGYDVLRSLKSKDSTRDIPVVVLSARASDAEIWEGWQAGADYYLTKPFNVDQLVEYIQLVLAEREAS
jgi:DNA-binding response OmpR family regulator